MAPVDMFKMGSHYTALNISGLVGSVIEDLSTKCMF